MANYIRWFIAVVVVVVVSAAPIDADSCDAGINVVVDPAGLDDDKLRAKMQRNVKVGVSVFYQSGILIGGVEPEDHEMRRAHVVFNASRWEWLKSDAQHMLLNLDLRYKAYSIGLFRLSEYHLNVNLTTSNLSCFNTLPVNDQLTTIGRKIKASLDLIFDDDRGYNCTNRHREYDDIVKDSRICYVALRPWTGTNPGEEVTEWGLSATLELEKLDPWQTTEYFCLSKDTDWQLQSIRHLDPYSFKNRVLFLRFRTIGFACLFGFIGLFLPLFYLKLFHEKSDVELRIRAKIMEEKLAGKDQDEDDDDDELEEVDGVDSKEVMFRQFQAENQRRRRHDVAAGKTYLKGVVKDFTYKRRFLPGEEVETQMEPEDAGGSSSDADESSSTSSATSSDEGGAIGGSKLKKITPDLLFRQKSRYIRFHKTLLYVPVNDSSPVWLFRLWSWPIRVDLTQYPVLSLLRRCFLYLGVMTSPVWIVAIIDLVYYNQMIRRLIMLEIEKDVEIEDTSLLDPLVFPSTSLRYVVNVVVFTSLAVLIIVFLMVLRTNKLQKWIRGWERPYAFHRNVVEFERKWKFEDTGLRELTNIDRIRKTLDHRMSLLVEADFWKTWVRGDNDKCRGWCELLGRRDFRGAASTFIYIFTLVPLFHVMLNFFYRFLVDHGVIIVQGVGRSADVDPENALLPVEEKRNGEADAAAEAATDAKAAAPVEKAVKEEAALCRKLNRCQKILQIIYAIFLTLLFLWGGIFPAVALYEASLIATNFIFYTITAVIINYRITLKMFGVLAFVFGYIHKLHADAHHFYVEKKIALYNKAAEFHASCVENRTEDEKRVKFPELVFIDRFHIPHLPKELWIEVLRVWPVWKKQVVVLVKLTLMAAFVGYISSMMDVFKIKQSEGKETMFDLSETLMTLFAVTIPTLLAMMQHRSQAIRDLQDEIVVERLVKKFLARRRYYYGQMRPKKRAECPFMMGARKGEEEEKNDEEGEKEEQSQDKLNNNPVEEKTAENVV